MNKQLLDALKFLLFVGLGFGILYLLYQSQQEAYLEECAKKGIAGADCSLVDKVLTDYRNSNWWWLSMTLVAFSISNLSRALRWNMLLRSFGSKPRLVNAFLTINLGYFANLGFPRLGEVIRPAAMARYENIKLERVVGTIVLGRTLDVVMLLIVSAAGFWIGRETLWAWLQENASIAEKIAAYEFLLYGLTVVGILTLIIIWKQWDRIGQTRIGGKIIGILGGFWEGIISVRRVESPLLFIFHTVNIWVMYILMTYFVFLAYPPTAGLPFEVALVTFVAGAFGIVIPSPGGMGSYHFLTQSALSLYGVPGEDGFTWANITFFTINIGCNVLIGLVALLLLPRINRDYKPAAPQPSAA